MSPCFSSHRAFFQVRYYIFPQVSLRPISFHSPPGRQTYHRKWLGRGCPIPSVGLSACRWWIGAGRVRKQCETVRKQEVLLQLHYGLFHYLNYWQLRQLPSFEIPYTYLDFPIDSTNKTYQKCRFHRESPTNHRVCNRLYPKYKVCQNSLS